MNLQNLDDIRALAALLEEYGLSGLELEVGEDRLALTRGAPAAPAPAAAAVPPPAGQAAPAETGGDNDKNRLTAPLVGSVYLAPAPGKAPFVQVGAAVKKGQVLCIIEAMKVMNEFLAPRAGTLAAIHVEDGQLVEYGQPLFTLE